jgi:hypothetical protein
VYYFAIHIHVFRASAPTGLKISCCSDSSHFEQTAAIINISITGILTTCRNQALQQISPPHIHRHVFLLVVLLLRCDKVSTHWSCLEYFRKTSDAKRTAGSILGCILIFLRCIYIHIVRGLLISASN